MKRRDAIMITGTVAILTICVVIGSFKKPLDLPKVDAISEPSVESVSEEESDYQAGFKEGYYAFKDQMGLSSIPSLPKSIKYLRDEGDEVDQEQRIKGYVDGYHRAADSMHCPGYSH